MLKKVLLNQQIFIAILLFLSHKGLELSGFFLLILLCIYSGYVQNSNDMQSIFYYIATLILLRPFVSLFGNPLLFNKHRFKSFLEISSRNKWGKNIHNGMETDREYWKIWQMMSEKIKNLKLCIYFLMSSLVSFAWMFFSNKKFIVLGVIFLATGVFMLFHFIILKRKHARLKTQYLKRNQKDNNDAYLL